MDRRIGKMIGIAAVIAVTLAAPFISLADDDVIDRITLEVTADIQVGEACSIRDFGFEVLSEGCEVREAELLNTNKAWGSTDVPRIIVYLRATDGGTFDVKPAAIRIKGADYEYGHYDENLFVYVLQIRLPSLREQVGGITEAYWNSPAAAEWSPSANAGYYEIRLYKDGKRQGSSVTTESASYDWGSYMRAEGTYYYKVCAVNRWDAAIRSRWKDSAAVVLDSAAAEQNRRKYPPPAANGPVTDTTAGQPAAGTQPYYHDMYGWIPEGTRWWYRNADGSYTASNWQFIDDKWYYFDSEGYMVTGWIDWNGKSYYCDPESGAMLTNTIVPDGLGLRVDSSGALIE